MVFFLYLTYKIMKSTAPEQMRKLPCLSNRLMYLKRRQSRGHTIAETVAGACILIPIALFLIDATVLIMANMTNDSVAKAAARAAANQADIGPSFLAARDSLKNFRTSSIIKSISLYQFTYYTDQSALIVGTKMEVQLPIPIPGSDVLILFARHTEAIVGLANK